MKKNTITHYDGSLIEDMNDKLSVVLEHVLSLSQDMIIVKKDLREIKEEAKFFRLGINLHDREIRDHELRITDLESS